MTNEEVIKRSALEWLQNNTTLNNIVEPFPAGIEIFIEKYGEVMGLRAGVASESISGLSQSFNVENISTLLKQYATELIGSEYMRSDIKVFPALDKWTY